MDRWLIQQSYLILKIKYKNITSKNVAYFGFVFVFEMKLFYANFVFLFHEKKVISFCHVI